MIVANVELIVSSSPSQQGKGLGVRSAENAKTNPFIGESLRVDPSATAAFARDDIEDMKGI
jgi:hypothetical protein